MRYSTLYVNGENAGERAVITKHRGRYISLPALFEGLGGEVTKNGDGSGLTILYEGVAYDCALDKNRESYDPPRLLLSDGSGNPLWNPRYDEIDSVSYGGCVVDDDEIYLGNYATWAFLDVLGYALIETGDGSSVSVIPFLEATRLGGLWVNGKKMEGDETLVVNGYTLIPFKAVLDGLGIEYYWEGDTVRLCIPGETYTCLLEAHGRWGSVTLKNDKSADRPVFLNSAVYFGEYKLIDGKAYLYDYEAKTFFEELGCVVNLDMKLLKTEIRMLSPQNGEGSLYVNGKRLKDGVIFEKKEMFIPLRHVFEALGGSVKWRGGGKDKVIIRYAGEIYTGWIGSFNEENSDRILIQNVMNTGQVNADSFLPLWSMGPDGSYRMIDGEIYLYSDTGRRLFEALGCEVDIDVEGRSVKISP
jgi:hypothetical protein